MIGLIVLGGLSYLAVAFGLAIWLGRPSRGAVDE